MDKGKKGGKTMSLSPDTSDVLIEMAKAALLAGEQLLKVAHNRNTIEKTEKSAGDFVSEADLMAEAIVSKHLRTRFPQHGWLAEEGGAQAVGTSGLRWVVDPLDGTTNFLKGLPHWATSIALCDGETPIAAIVLDPSKRELFSAESGKGAYLNGHPITVSDETSLASAVLATGLPAGGRITYLPHSLQDIETTMPLSAGLRRWGAAALDLAYVAAGRFDVYWERNLGPWDVAAGILLVQEAGGRITPLWAEKSIFSSGSFLASNGVLHDAIEPRLNNVP